MVRSSCRIYSNSKGKVLLVLAVLLELTITFVYADQDEDKSTRKIEMNSILNDIAREIGNSQVLSLNLTNIIIWLVLKGLLFGAAYVSQGHWKGHRSIDESAGDIFQGQDTIIDEKEILLFLGYAMGETTENYDCLKRIACIEPKKAKQYASAARMLLNGAKFVFSPLNPKYEKLINEVQHAIHFGRTTGDCDGHYKCSVKDEAPY